MAGGRITIEANAGVAKVLRSGTAAPTENVVARHTVVGGGVAGLEGVEVTIYWAETVVCHISHRVVAETLRAGVDIIRAGTAFWIGADHTAVR